MILQASQLEKKQKNFDKTINEWQSKCASLQSEVDMGNQESRSLSAEVFKCKSQNEELVSQISGLNREHKNLEGEFLLVYNKII